MGSGTGGVVGLAVGSGVEDIVGNGAEGLIGNGERCGDTTTGELELMLHAALLCGIVQFARLRGLAVMAVLPRVA